MAEPRHRRSDRVGAGRHDQRVVAEHALRVLLAQVHLPRCRVDQADPGVQPQVDATVLAKLLGRISQQVLGLPDHARQVVRDAAHAIGGEAPGLADDHVEAGRGPPRGRRGRHPRGAAADHHYPWHLPSSSSGSSGGRPAAQPGLLLGASRQATGPPVRSPGDQRPAWSRPAR